MDQIPTRTPNPRRRKKTKMEIIKEAYLPTVFLGLTALLVIIFLVGGAIRRSSPSVPETTPPPSTQNTENIALQQEANALLNQAAALAADYDYAGAVDVLESFSGDPMKYPELITKRQEYREALASLVTWSDPSQVTTLSFHMLIADGARAFTNQSYGKAYNRNFVTIQEFSQILEQLYANGYILVSLSDIAEMTTVDDRPQMQGKQLQLPAGKKPLLLTQTNVNYYTYMVDGNGDGLADQNGAGFASCLKVDANGALTCEMVDAQGNVTTGNYDLVPILNDFIARHPDFSYRGAKAVLAVSGYDGIFGWRTDPETKDKLGQDFYDRQVAEAQSVVNALRADGYELACYTYGNVSYGEIGASEIQADLKKWTAEVTPILGQTDILVYAQNTQLGSYEGTKYNVLKNAGFRYYLGFADGSLSSQMGADYLLQQRITVTGSQMAHTPSIYAGFFDASQVLDPQRGNVPQ